ncbi:hypothetical protein D3C84_1104010 [compost metagenome]
MQPHHFHQQLVGVGGAVEGAGADAVIRGGFGFQQRLAVSFTFGIQLAHTDFFFIR